MTSWVKEEWRDIPGYEGRYQASNLGQIRSIDHYVTRLFKGKTLRQRIRKEGYLQVSLSEAGGGKPKDVHRLVALAFHGPGKPGEQVRHLDGDPLNCRPENLAWGSQSDNEKDKLRYGKKSRKLTAEQVLEIRQRTAAGETKRSIADDYKVTTETVRHIEKGVTFSWL